MAARLGTWTTHVQRRIFLGAVACLCAIGVAGCGEPASDPVEGYRIEPPGALRSNVQSRALSPEIDGQALTALVSGNTTFALELLQVLRERSPAENVTFSPYSISHAMAMLYAGAGGDTAQALRDVLHFQGNPGDFHNTFNGLDLELAARNSDIVLRNSNQLWVQSGFQPNPEFLDVLVEHYGAPLASLDFASDADAARDAINEWVEEATEGKISELFPSGSLSADTALVLSNAIYMDAPWKYAFNPKGTFSLPFTLLDGTQVDVETMSYGEFLPSGSGQGWQAVELPYRGDEVSMFVVVPEDLLAFESTLTLARLNEILADIEDGGIHLRLPRFSFRFHVSLVDALEALGLGSLFDAPDLSGIADAGLSVGQVEHEAFIEVDEKGTRAAGATGVGIPVSHGPEISVDRPFLFFVMDKRTKTLLFTGRVLDPR